jgi:nucleotide-binding universal stress UspA family protein
MFKQILVPLDGSARAEQALPVAIQLAKASGGSLLLVRIISASHEFGSYATGMGAAVFLQEAIEQELLQATAYLAEIAHTLMREHVKARIATSVGQAAPYILETAREQKSELIVMCSHGYTGFKRWALGSVAEKVSRRSPIPVLLVREQNLSLNEKLAHSLRATVALDGSPEAEAAVRPAADLVAALSAPEKGELHLLRLVDVPTLEEEFGYLLDTDFAVRQEALQNAGDYLQNLRARLLYEGFAHLDLQVSWSVEECTNVADAIIQVTMYSKGIGARKASDLVVLATHGHSGFRRWIAGGVTEHVLHESTLPLFIVHVSPAIQRLSERKAEPQVETLGRDSEKP